MEPNPERMTSLRLRSTKVRATSKAPAKATAAKKKATLLPKKHPIVTNNKSAQSLPSTEQIVAIVTPTKLPPSAAYLTRASSKFPNVEQEIISSKVKSSRESKSKGKKIASKKCNDNQMTDAPALGKNEIEGDNLKHATEPIVQDITPIAKLDIFSTAKRAIRAKVHRKGPLSEFSKNGQNGNRFDVVVADSAVDRMKITFFDNPGKDSRYDNIEVGQTYDFVGGLLNGSNPAYNEGCSCKYNFKFNPKQGSVTLVDDPIQWEDDDNPEEFVLIKDLEQNNFNQALSATITFKSEISSFSRGNAEGHWFVIELQDDSGTVRGKFFNEAAQSFYDRLEVSSMYTFADFSVSKSKHQYDSCSSDFEILFEVNSRIELI